MLLRNSNRSRWSLKSIALSGIEFQHGMLGSGNIAEGQLRNDGYMFYVPLTPNVEYSANGCPVRLNSLAVMAPGCEFSICTKVPHDWVAVFVPTSFFDNTNDGSDEVLTCQKGKLWVADANVNEARQILSVSQQVLSTIQCSSEFESTSGAENVSDVLMSLVSAIIFPRQVGNQAREGRPRYSREEIILRSKQQLENVNGNFPRINELAAAVGVSERTLRAAFNEYYGIGPVSYLQLQQLNAIRRTLKSADPNITTVSSILTAHGVWELSRFARRYKRTFGELPSVTHRSS